MFACLLACLTCLVGLSIRSFEIELEFLGKDSMLYKQNINFGLYGDLGKQVLCCVRMRVCDPVCEHSTAE